MSKFTGNLQLQFWDATAKRYIIAEQQTTDADEAHAIAKGRPWRIAKSDRLTLNPRHQAPRSTGSSRTADEVCSQYLAWARAANLHTVAYWTGKFLTMQTGKDKFGRPNGPHVSAEQYFTVNRVNPDDYFTATETIDAPSVALGDVQVAA